MLKACVCVSFSTLSFVHFWRSSRALEQAAVLLLCLLQCLSAVYLWRCYSRRSLSGWLADRGSIG